MDLENFLKAIWGEGVGLGCLTFKTVEGKWVDQYIHYPKDLNQVTSLVSQQDAVGSDCYFVPSLLKFNSRKKLSFKQSAVAWVDIDNEAAPQFDIEPSILIQTSEKGHHAYWKLEEPVQSTQDLEQINKALAVVNSADKSGVDATQLLRLPYTQSKKRDFPVAIVQATDRKFKKDDLPK